MHATPMREQILPDCFIMERNAICFQLMSGSLVQSFASPLHSSEGRWHESRDLEGLVYYEFLDVGLGCE